jgi:hypothetical protein
MLMTYAYPHPHRLASYDTQDIFLFIPINSDLSAVGFGTPLIDILFPGRIPPEMDVVNGTG